MWWNNCHGSPHAQIPSREASDNYQAQAYQHASLPLGACQVCHEGSHGEGLEEFGEAHGGSGGRSSACRVCHTQVPSNTAAGPHSLRWRSR